MVVKPRSDANVNGFGEASGYKAIPRARDGAPTVTIRFYYFPRTDTKVIDSVVLGAGEISVDYQVLHTASEIEPGLHSSGATALKVGLY